MRLNLYHRSRAYPLRCSVASSIQRAYHRADRRRPIMASNAGGFTRHHAALAAARSRVRTPLSNVSEPLQQDLGDAQESPQRPL
jgi:hypothetical protein